MASTSTRNAEAVHACYLRTKMPARHVEFAGKTGVPRAPNDPRTDAQAHEGTETNQSGRMHALQTIMSHGGCSKRRQSEVDSSAAVRPCSVKTRPFARHLIVWPSLIAFKVGCAAFSRLHLFPSVQGARNRATDVLTNQPIASSQKKKDQLLPV